MKTYIGLLSILLAIALGQLEIITRIKVGNQAAINASSAQLKEGEQIELQWVLQPRQNQTVNKSSLKLTKDGSIINITRIANENTEISFALLSAKIEDSGNYSLEVINGSLSTIPSVISLSVETRDDPKPPILPGGITITSLNGTTVNGVYGESVEIVLNVVFHQPNHQLTTKNISTQVFNLSSLMFVDYNEGDYLYKISNFTNGSRTVTLIIPKLNYSEPLQHVRIMIEPWNSLTSMASIKNNSIVLRINILDRVRSCGDTNWKEEFKIKEYDDLNIFYTACGNPTPLASFEFIGFSPPAEQVKFTQKQIINHAQRFGFVNVYNTTLFDFQLSNVSREFCGKLKFSTTGGYEASNESSQDGAETFLEVMFTPGKLLNISAEKTPYKYLIIQWDQENTGTCVVNEFFIRFGGNNSVIAEKNFTTNTENGNVFAQMENVDEIETFEIWAIKNNTHGVSSGKLNVSELLAKDNNVNVNVNVNTQDDEDDDDVWKIIAYVFIGTTGFLLLFILFLIITGKYRHGRNDQNQYELQTSKLSDDSPKEDVEDDMKSDVYQIPETISNSRINQRNSIKTSPNQKQKQQQYGDEESQGYETLQTNRLSVNRPSVRSEQPPSNRSSMSGRPLIADQNEEQIPNSMYVNKPPSAKSSFSNRPHPSISSADHQEEHGVENHMYMNKPMTSSQQDEPYSDVIDGQKRNVHVNNNQVQAKTNNGYQPQEIYEAMGEDEISKLARPKETSESFYEVPNENA